MIWHLGGVCAQVNGIHMSYELLEAIYMVDESLMEFIKTNFPGCAGELKVSLELLIGTVEMTVDLIEEKSSELIKKNRDFSKSNEYRNKAEQLYQAVNIIQEYMEGFDIEANNKPYDEYAENIESKANDEEAKKTPDYSQYLVDPNIEHNLYEDYTYKRPAAFELRESKIEVKDWKEMLIETANLLVSIDKNIISAFPENIRMNGKKMIYFSFKEDESMRSPRKLRDIDIYVATNHSANQIRTIIFDMLREYKIPLSEYKIYLKADYSELH